MTHDSTITGDQPRALAAPDGVRDLKLYELTGEYAALKDLITNLGDVADDDPALMALSEALGALSGAIEQKAIGVGRVVIQQNAEADWLEHRAQVFQAEADRLRSHAAARRNGAERLKQYLANQLAALGPDTQRIQLPDVRVTLAKQQEREAVVVVDDTLLPPDFKRATLRMPASKVPAELTEYVVNVDVDKQELNDYVEKEGVVPPGCETRPVRRTIRVT